MLRVKIKLMVLLSIFSVSLKAELPWLLQQNYIAENYEVRRRKAWLFNEPLAQILESEQGVYLQKNNEAVLFQVRVNTKRPQYVYYTFINENQLLENSSDVENTGFSLEQKGNYVIRRTLNAPEGLDQIKIFLTSNKDSESAIRLQRQIANEEASIISLKLYGKEVYSDFRLPYSLEAIAEWPLRKLVAETSEWLPWSFILGKKDRTNYQQQVNYVMKELHPLLPLLRESYDGSLDMHGNFVRIATGEKLSSVGFNCSGFVKWVLDGIYHNNKKILYGDNFSNEKYLATDITQLKKRQLSYRGELNSWNQAIAQQRDPYFGLDWSRALAAELNSLEVGVPVEPESSDVRNSIFFYYYEDVGYQIDELEALLYSLSLSEPGYFYLATLNGDFGSPPRHQYYHVALLLPYFDQQGDFQVYILDTTTELSIQDFQEHHKARYVHLNRVAIPYRYHRFPLTHLPE